MHDLFESWNDAFVVTSELSGMRVELRCKVGDAAAKPPAPKADTKPASNDKPAESESAKKVEKTQASEGAKLINENKVEESRGAAPEAAPADIAKGAASDGRTDDAERARITGETPGNAETGETPTGPVKELVDAQIGEAGADGRDTTDGAADTNLNEARTASQGANWDVQAAKETLANESATQEERDAAGRALQGGYDTTLEHSGAVSVVKDAELGRIGVEGTTQADQWGALNSGVDAFETRDLKFDEGGRPDGGGANPFAAGGVYNGATREETINKIIADPGHLERMIHEGENGIGANLEQADVDALKEMRNAARGYQTSETTEQGSLGHVDELDTELTGVQDRLVDMEGLVAGTPDQAGALDGINRNERAGDATGANVMDSAAEYMAVADQAVAKGVLPDNVEVDANGDMIMTVGAGDSYYSVADKLSAGDTLDPELFQQMIDTNVERLGHGSADMLRPGDQIILPERAWDMAREGIGASGWTPTGANREQFGEDPAGSTATVPATTAPADTTDTTGALGEAAGAGGLEAPTTTTTPVVPTAPVVPAVPETSAEIPATPVVPATPAVPPPTAQVPPVTAQVPPAAPAPVEPAPPAAPPVLESGAQMLPSGAAWPVDGGAIIQHPYEGTHTLDNWESDRALDIEAPEGTAIYSPVAGTITYVQGDNNDPSSQFNGYQLQVQGADDKFFLTHLSAVDVEPGMTVTAGQRIGAVGSANNVSHLHIAQETGNPEETFAR